MIHYYFFKVVYKDGTGHGSSGSGNGWTTVMGKMKQLSVGSQVMRSPVKIKSNYSDEVLNSTPGWGKKERDNINLKKS